MKPETTISVNGGPQVPLSTVRKALDMVKRGRVRAAAKVGAEAEAKAEAAASGAPEEVAGDRLRSLVERIERLQEERKALASDIKDIFAEANSAGFDVKALRQVIRMRTWDPGRLEEHETLVDVYRRALGM